MQMTEEFSRVNSCFLEASNQALMAGRWPTKILLGPEEFEAWNVMVKMNPDFKPNVEYRFEGYLVRPMASPGVAVITKALPLSSPFMGGPVPKGFF